MPSKIHRALRRRVLALTCLAPVGLLPLLALPACSDSGPPPSQVVTERESSLVRGPEPGAAEASRPGPLELEVKLRSETTRVGEAVRVHVSAWHDDAETTLAPQVEIDGPAKVEAMGSEIVDARPGAVRERWNYRIEPGGRGRAQLRVRVGEHEHPEAIVLRIERALSPAELAALTRTHAGRLARGRALAQQGDYRRAIGLFRASLEARPHDPAVLGELGWAAFLAGQHNLARRATREGLRFAETGEARGALLYNLGRVAEARGRVAEAIEAYRRSRTLRPQNAAVSGRLARVEARADEAAAAPRCVGPRCPLVRGADRIRACELIEEEACRFLQNPAICSCSLDEAHGLGPWQLVSLSDRDKAAAVHTLIFAHGDGDEPRFDVFAPLHWTGQDHEAHAGGIEEAELIRWPRGSGVRIDLSSTRLDEALPDVDGEHGGPGPARTHRFTILCGAPSPTLPAPSCSAALVTGFEPGPEAPPFVAELEFDEGGMVSLEVTGGTAPTPAQLAEAFPDRRVRVLDDPTSIDQILTGS